MSSSHPSRESRNASSEPNTPAGSSSQVAPNRTSEFINEAAANLEPPRISPVIRKTDSFQSPQSNGNGSHASHSQTQEIRRPSRHGVTTEWETPYNRPAFESSESVQYSRLASQYLQQGRIEDAERLYNLGLEVAERTLKSDDPGVTKALEDLAGFYLAREKFASAEPFVSRVLEQRIQRLSPDDSLLIRTVDQLSEIYEQTKRVDQALALYKFLLARQEEILGRNSETVAFTLSRLAECYSRQNNLSACEALLSRILGIQESLFGRSSIEISNTLQELSRIYHLQHRFDKAAEMLERLLHILESIHGENGLAVASCLLKLADLLTEVNMTREAEPLYRRAQAIYQRSYGNETSAHSLIRNKLSTLKSKQDVETRAVTEADPEVQAQKAEQATCNKWPAYYGDDTDELETVDMPNSNGNGNGSVTSDMSILKKVGVQKPQSRQNADATREDLMVLAVTPPAVAPSQLTPEPFPNARKRKASATQKLFPVNMPHQPQP